MVSCRLIYYLNINRVVTPTNVTQDPFSWMTVRWLAVAQNRSFQCSLTRFGTPTDRMPRKTFCSLLIPGNIFSFCWRMGGFYWTLYVLTHVCNLWHSFMLKVLCHIWITQPLLFSEEWRLKWMEDTALHFEGLKHFVQKVRFILHVSMIEF
jgi:hypothetical protein